MTKATGKFKQLRLGEVQKQILSSLVELKEYHANRVGYTIKEIIENLYNYISIPSSSFWTPSIEAQSSLEDGNIKGSAEVLLNRTYELSEKAIERSFYGDERRIGKYKIAVVAIPAMLESLKKQDVTLADQEVAHKLALEIATTVVESSPFYRQVNNLLAGHTDEDISRASQEANKRYASVSRAIRVLVQHGLLEKVCWETPRWTDGPLESHSGYAITDLGRLRLNE